MADIRQQQSKNFNRLLDEVGKSQKEIAAIVGVSEETFSHWVNGQVHIRRKNAQRVHDEFPAYSVEFLLGETRQLIMEQVQEAHVLTITEEKCIETLLYSCGVADKSFACHFSELPMKNVSVDCGDGQVWEGVMFDDYIQFTYKGSDIKLTMEQWRAFKKEIKGYIRLRLKSMSERGCW